MVPKDALIAVTSRCNARCVMCNIWKEHSNADLPVEALKKLPSTLRYVNVSGGEPFLRPDLPEVIKALKDAAPKAKVIISSNGLLTGKITEAMSEILTLDRGIGVAVSIDGIGPLHEKIRGIDGAFSRAMGTIDALKAIGVKNLRLAFTAGPINLVDLTNVFHLSRQSGVQFTCGLVHASDIYFKLSDNQEVVEARALWSQLNQVAGEELRSMRPKKWLRAYFYKGLLTQAGGGPRELACTAASSSFFVDSGARVYPCNILGQAMGALTDSGFADIWQGSPAQAARRRVRQCRLNCWMICTARMAMRQSMPAVLNWVLGAKIRAHLGRAVL